MGTSSVCVKPVSAVKTSSVLSSRKAFSTVKLTWGLQSYYCQMTEKWCSIEQEHLFPKHKPIYLWLYSPVLDLGCFSVSWSFTQSVELLRWGINPGKAATCTHRTAQTQNKGTHIHASSRIRIHDPSVWVREDSSCLRPRGNCDRL
jgi:hypothetical protein